MHPHTKLKFINSEIGHGIVATQLIPKGTIVWVQDELDQVFTPDQVNNLNELSQEFLDTYTYRNKNGHFVLCWDHARFVNHSFDSNCMTTPYDFEIAIRDIWPGEQLTDDYGYLNIASPFQAAKEEGSHRQIVYPNDLLRYYSKWDEKIADTFSLIPQVEQLLEPLLSSKTLSKIDSINTGESILDSILTNYYDPEKGPKQEPIFTIDQ